MVGLLNQVQQDVETRKQESHYRRTIEKYNELTKNINDYVSAPIDLAKYFTKQEIAFLKHAGKITRFVGRGTVLVDAGLTIDAFSTGPLPLVSLRGVRGQAFLARLQNNGQRNRLLLRQLQPSPLPIVSLTRGILFCVCNAGQSNKISPFRVK